MSLRYLFVSYVNQGSEEIKFKKVGSKFSFVAPGME